MSKNLALIYSCLPIKNEEPPYNGVALRFSKQTGLNISIQQPQFSQLQLRVLPLLLREVLPQLL